MAEASDLAGMAERFRARSQEYLKATEEAIKKFQPDTLAVVAVIVGQVNAEVNNALADVLDYQAAQRTAIRQEILQEKNKAFADKQNEIRVAAAAGVSDVEWNRIVNPSAEPVGAGSGGGA